MSGLPGHADVAVVGGGMAGLVAAVRAAESGGRVVVLERGMEPAYPCNTRYSGGALHVAYRDVTEDQAALRSALDRATSGHARPELAAALAANSGRVRAWLQAQGARFIRGGPAASQQNLLAPPIPNQPGLAWEGRGPDVLLRTLERRLTELGGSLVRGAEAMALDLDDGRVTGVRAGLGTTDGLLRTPAVVLADGGYQSAHDLLRRHLTEMPEALLQRGAATGSGSGLRMAAEAGAAIEATGRFYGHLVSRDALANARLWPHPVLDFVAMAGIVVDGEGRRFTDEGLGGIAAANALARLADPSRAFVVFDEAIWSGPAGAAKLVPPNPHLVRNGGTMHSAASLEALARMAGLPEAVLAGSVAAYNRALAAGACGGLAPPRSAGNPALPFGIVAAPIATPPFHAVPVIAGITYTTDGIVIDAGAAVLRPDGTPLPGLFAAGATTAGIEGGPASSYVGGLMKAAVFGLLAGESAARAGSRPP